MLLRLLPALACGLSLAAAACKADAPPPGAPPDAPPLDAPPFAAALDAPDGSPPAPERAEVAASQRLFIGASARHACLLDDDGTLRCWGNNAHGQLGGRSASVPQFEPKPVPGLGPAAHAALGARHTCAALRDGKVQCWGNNADGQLGGGGGGDGDEPGLVTVQGLGEVAQLVAGEAFTCALTAAHAVLCWGRVPGGAGISPEPRPVPGLEATRLSAAARAACAVRTSGAVACWGENKLGRIVPKGPSEISAPADVPGLIMNAVDVATGAQGSCGIKSGERGDEVHCWGEPHFSSSWIYAQYSLEGARAVTAGDAGHFCVIQADETIHCWGDRSTGASGAAGEYRWSHDFAGRFAEVRAGENFTCARTREGAVQCWGTNDSGQLSQSFSDAMAPVPLEGAEGARRIAAAGTNTCAILKSGAVRCWGPDQAGYVEGGGPHDFPSIMRADELAMGGAIACAMTDKLPTCWGHNRASQLPSQDAVAIGTASTLASLGGNKALAFGSEHACSLSDAGAVTCWGGLGRTRALSTPVSGLRGAASIALGADEGCALLDDGGVSCWPLREPPQGAKGASPRFAAARVPGVRGAVAIAHGEAHACAALASGGALCWGRGDGGALGREAAGAAGVGAVEGLTDADALALGDGFGCARRRDGTVACWGRNDRGQLGDGTREGRPAARAVPDVAEVTQLVAGAGHACALTRAGEVRCWGDNRMRQVRQASPLISRAPVTVPVPVR